MLHKTLHIYHLVPVVFCFSFKYHIVQLVHQYKEIHLCLT